MKMPVYLDYNATTPIASEVLQEMLPFLQSKFGNPSSNNGLGIEAKEGVEKARQQVARFIGAQPDEIFFTSGGTESNNHAIKGIAFANSSKGKHIITSSIEHPAVIEVCKHLELLGWEVTYLPVNQMGTVQSVDVEKAIREDTVLITIMHANNEVGTVQPVEEIGRIAKRHNIVFHSDAAQSAGKILIDVEQMGTDLLSIAGHKLYAPKGVGVLYMRKGVQLDNLLFGASQEKGRRPGTENVPFIVALGKACEVARENLGKNSRHLFEMRQCLLEGLKIHCQTNIITNGNLNNCLPNTLNISFPNVDVRNLLRLLNGKVLFSTGSACHAQSSDISPVLKAMHVNPLHAFSAVRISTGRYTTQDEIDYAVKAISEQVNMLL